jgi:hypothetical protein
MCNNRDPDCWSSTVVRGRGFLVCQLRPKVSLGRKLSSPLRRRLSLNFCHCGLWVSRALLKEDDGRLHVEQVIPPPFELNEAFSALRLFFVVCSIYRDVDIPKSLWYEGLDTGVLIHYKAESGELAGAFDVSYFLMGRLVLRPAYRMR